MSNAENVILIHNLIVDLIDKENHFFNNKYYVTNICVKLVRLSFEYIKKLDRSETLIIKAYDECVKILTEISNTGIKFASHVDLIREFENKIYQLEQLNSAKILQESANPETYDSEA